jgi:uncharacterized protein YjbI with pentapeptide repeats
LTRGTCERHLRSSEEGDVVFTLAQARTTTTITQLDGEQNQIVTRFLSGSGLLRKPALLAKVDLQDAKLHRAVLQNANLADTYLKGANLTDAVLVNADFSTEENVGGGTQTTTADLPKADLSRATLLGANLSGCYLKEATLTDANLQSADLSSANLHRADLSRAALQGADLSIAESTPNLQDQPLWVLKKLVTNLTDANLSHAALQHADLSSAELTDADLTDADLTGADLTDVKGWTTEQLTAARSLEGATMPNGQTYEDWLKAQEARRADRKNSGPS